MAVAISAVILLAAGAATRPTQDDIGGVPTTTTTTAETATAATKKDEGAGSADYPAAGKAAAVYLVVGGSVAQTGFLIDGDGHLLTRQIAGPVTIVDRNGVQRAAAVIATDPVIGISIIDSRDVGQEALVPRNEPGREGEQVYTIGSAQSGPNPISTGRLQRATAEGQPLQSRTVNDDTRADNLYVGAPVVDTAGHVIAVAIGPHADGIAIADINPIMRRAAALLTRGPQAAGTIAATLNDGTTTVNKGDSREIHAGDTILAVDGTNTPTAAVLAAVLAPYLPGDTVTVTANRQGRMVTVQTTIVAV